MQSPQTMTQRTLSRSTTGLTLAAATLALALGLTGEGAFAQQPAPAAAGVLAQAPSASTAGVGTVTHLSGTLAVRKNDGATRFLSVSSAIGEGDTLTTQQGTYARVKFADGSEVVMRPQTQFKIDNYKFDEQKPESDNMLVSLLKGGLRSVSGVLGKRNRDRVSCATPTATVGIRGTNFGLLYCQGDCSGIAGAGKTLPNGLHVDVAQGAVILQNAGGTLVLATGQFGFVAPGGAPVVVPPSQGIQVTMPQSISRNAGGGSTLGGRRTDSECAL